MIQCLVIKGRKCPSQSLLTHHLLCCIFLQTWQLSRAVLVCWNAHQTNPVELQQSAQIPPCHLLIALIQTKLFLTPRVNVSLSPTPSFLWGLPRGGGLFTHYATWCFLCLTRKLSLLLCSCRSNLVREGGDRSLWSTEGKSDPMPLSSFCQQFWKDVSRFYAQVPLCCLDADSLSTCQTT